MVDPATRDMRYTREHLPSNLPQYGWYLALQFMNGIFIVS